MKNHEYHEAILASDLTANAKLTALAISYHFNWKGSKAAFPSIATLVKRTSLSRASVYRAKSELSKKGYLDSTRRFNDSNLYVPVIPAQSQIDTLGVSEGRTNNEYNNEINNEQDANASLDVINLNQDGYWKAFDNEERYTRRHAAGGRNKKSGNSNKSIGRNNSSSTGVAGLYQELENIGGQQ